MNDRIMDKVEAKLKAYECKTIRVDDTTGAKDISLSNRAKTANNAGAKAYIAMHHNAGLKGKKVIGGLMVFYGLLTEARQGQALELYHAIQNCTGLPVNPDRARVVYERFTVLTKTKMPAFLVENGFMDSQIDVPIILTEAHAEKTANGVVSFLVSEYDLKKKKASQIATDKATGASYTVVKGDTLSKIGTKFGVAWKDIAAANGIRAPYTINIGKVLTIPGAKTKSIYYPAYTGKTVTLSAALASLDIDSSYAFRKKIAAANGIKGYIGSAAQNTSMYNMLKAGLLKKA